MQLLRRRRAQKSEMLTNLDNVNTFFLIVCSFKNLRDWVYLCKLLTCDFVKNSMVLERSARNDS